MSGKDVKRTDTTLVQWRLGRVRGVTASTIAGNRAVVFELTSTTATRKESHCTTGRATKKNR